MEQASSLNIVWKFTICFFIVSKIFILKRKEWWTETLQKLMQDYSCFVLWECFNNFILASHLAVSPKLLIENCRDIFKSYFKITVGVMTFFMNNCETFQQPFKRDEKL